MHAITFCIFPYSILSTRRFLRVQPALCSRYALMKMLPPPPRLPTTTHCVAVKLRQTTMALGRMRLAVRRCDATLQRQRTPTSCAVNFSVRSPGECGAVYAGWRWHHHTRRTASMSVEHSSTGIPMLLLLHPRGVGGADVFVHAARLMACACVQIRFNT